MPLTADLAHLIRQDLGSKLPPTLERLGDDIELWLAFLAEPQPWLHEGDNFRNRASFHDITESIARNLRGRQESAVERKLPSWAIPLCQHFVESQATIITFNYDVLLETLLMNILADDESHSGGLYPIPILNPARRNSAIFGDDFDYRAPVTVLKLHGSLNWYWSGPGSPPGDPVYNLGVGSTGWGLDGIKSPHANAARMVADKQVMIVPPIASKSGFYDNTLLRQQWAYAADALRTANELVVIGYSLPPSDLVVRALLATCSEIGRVVPVDVSASAVVNLRRTFEPAHGGAASWEDAGRNFNSNVVENFIGHEPIAKFVASGFRV